jgi:hypothetical protein
VTIPERVALLLDAARASGDAPEPEHELPRFDALSDEQCLAMDEMFEGVTL